jgi:hypothetical protein
MLGNGPPIQLSLVADAFQTSPHSTARPKGTVGTAASTSNIAATTAKQSINPIATAAISLPPGSMADDPAGRFTALVAGIKAA